MYNRPWPSIWFQHRSMEPQPRSFTPFGAGGMRPYMSHFPSPPTFRSAARSTFSLPSFLPIPPRRSDFSFSTPSHIPYLHWDNNTAKSDKLTLHSDIEDCWNSWSSRMHSEVLKRRQSTEDVPIALPEIRARFLKWSKLIRDVKDKQSSNSPLTNNFSCEMELAQIQSECTDSNLIESIKRKIFQARKKRLYRRRVREQRRNSTNIAVLRTSVSSVLDYLHQSPYETYTSSQPSDNNSIANEKPDRSPSRRPQSHTTADSYRLKIRQAISECRERLDLIDALTELRSARLLQARQKGGLFPEAFDQAFAAQMARLSSLLRAQLAKLSQAENAQNLDCATENTGNKEVSNTSNVARCDHWPNLPNAWKEVFFYASTVPKDIPWRWWRFYHQADCNFSDFLRIRTAWDSYLVYPTTEEQQSSQTDASPLPEPFHLPPDEDTSNVAWKAYLPSKNVATHISTQ